MKLLIFGYLIFSLNIYAAINSKVNIDIDELFIVKNGYDSNDNIEFTLYAQLPSACYQVDKINISKIDSNEFQVTLTAKSKNLSGCIISELSYPVGFSQSISLGELAEGAYKIKFNEHKEKIFHVKRAQMNTIDENIYAPISSAFIPELIYSNEELNVILTGTYNTNCMFLNDDQIKVIREGNIFIILPILSLQNVNNCRRMQLPLQNIIELGEIKDPGNYLIHIRSLSGLSINKVFKVIKRENSPVGHN